MIICENCRNIFKDNNLPNDKLAIIRDGQNNKFCPIEGCNGQLIDLDDGMDIIVNNLWDKHYIVRHSYSSEGYHNRNTTEFPSIAIKVDTEINNNGSLVDFKAKCFGPFYLNIWALILTCSDPKSFSEEHPLYIPLKNYIIKYKLPYLYHILKNKNMIPVVWFNDGMNTFSTRNKSTTMHIMCCPDRLGLHPENPTIFTYQHCNTDSILVEYKDFNQFKADGLNCLYDWVEKLDDYENLTSKENVE